MSGWFGSGGLGIMGGGMPYRQQYNPDDDPMNNLMTMLGGRPPAAGTPVGSSGPPLRRMRGTPRTLFGGTPADVGGQDEAGYVTRLRPAPPKLPSGGYGYGDFGGVGASGLGNPSAYSSNFSQGGIPGINGVQGPHMSAGMYRMQDLANQMHQNNQNAPKPRPTRNPQMDELMAGIGGYEAAHAARQRMMDNNMAAFGAMSRPNGGFVHGPNGMRSLPLVAPNGNIDAELARAQQIRADGRLAQGGLDQFTRKWRGINQNMPMPMEDNGPSPELQARREQLMADMAKRGSASTGLTKGSLGMSIGGSQSGATQDRYNAEKVRRNEAIQRGNEFRQNRMMAVAQQNAMSGPDPQHALAAVMPYMMHPAMPGAQQNNAALMHMAGMIHQGNVQTHGQMLAHQQHMAQLGNNAALGGAQIAANGGVNPFVPAPRKPFNYADIEDVLGHTSNQADKDALSHIQQRGVDTSHLMRYIGDNQAPKLGEGMQARILREFRVQQAQRLAGLLPHPNGPAPQQPAPAPSGGPLRNPQWNPAALLQALGLI